MGDKFNKGQKRKKAKKWNEAIKINWFEQIQIY